MAVSFRAEAVVQEGGIHRRERPARGTVHILRPQGVGPAILRRQRADDCELVLVMLFVSLLFPILRRIG